MAKRLGQGNGGKGVSGNRRGSRRNSQGRILVPARSVQERIIMPRWEHAEDNAPLRRSPLSMPVLAVGSESHTGPTSKSFGVPSRKVSAPR
jgi:hypothetical protein